MDLRFEWSEAKNQANFRKHGVWFEDAQTAFYDPNGRLIDDPDHSEDEKRFLMLGMAHDLRMLIVAHSLREAGDVIRIISTRKATKEETKEYVEYL